MQSLSLFQTFTTNRLILRELKLDDAHDLFILRSDKRVNKYLDRPKTITINDAKAFIKKIHAGINKNGWFYWAITLKSNNELIGTVCLWHIDKENGCAELGYELRPDFQGKGLMHEAVSAIINYSFIILKYKKIAAFTNPANKQSIRLLEKNNFCMDEGIYDKINNEISFSLKAPT